MFTVCVGKPEFLNKLGNFVYGLEFWSTWRGFRGNRGGLFVSFIKSKRLWYFGALYSLIEITNNDNLPDIKINAIFVRRPTCSGIKLLLRKNPVKKKNKIKMR